MKQRQLPTPKKGIIQTDGSAFLQSSSKPPLADSQEVIVAYYTERINELGRQMELLNLLEDAAEIEFLCHKIMEARHGLTSKR